MKYAVLFFLSLSFLESHAQTKLVPAKNAVERKWMSSQKYEMVWYALRDTARFEIGKVLTEINNSADKITVITQVNMKRSNTPWIDSTIAMANDLSPVYHSSYNAQRDMALNFGKIVTGYYSDKIKKTTTIIKDTTKEDYFDSNLYPVILTWLPLKEGYKQDISIYDYNPSGRIGVIKASVEDVKKGKHETERSGSREVWIVTVSDEIGGSDSKMTYYIDQADRKLWKQEINAGARKMLMLRVEN